MEKPTIPLHGVFPPIPTPFDAQGHIAHDALVENLKRWNQYDLAGYVVLGSNGEGVYLTVDEKAQVWEVARQAIPADKLLVAGTGCESTRQTIALGSRAADAGADALLVLTPHYYDGQMTPDALTRHFEAVADHAAVPVILYNMPRLTHVDMDAVTVTRLAQHPNVIGIKDSGGDVSKLAQIVGAVEDGFQVLAGSAGFFFPALTVGAVGGVMALANVAPQPLIDLYRLFQAGRWDEAAAVQRRLVPVNTAVTARFGVPGLKAALDMLGYYGGPVRSPLQKMADRELQQLRRVLVAGKTL